MRRPLTAITAAFRRNYYKNQIHQTLLELAKQNKEKWDPAIATAVKGRVVQQEELEV